MDTVWIATEQYPESDVVIVGADEDAVLKAIVENIGREDYEQFTDSLQGDQATDVTYDDDPKEVLMVWAGPINSRCTNGAFWIGAEWFVRPVEVAQSE